MIKLTTGVCYESMKGNKNIVLATTKDGGHCAYQAHLVENRMQFWFSKVMFEFFKGIEADKTD